jgi:hypothetical protein
MAYVIAQVSDVHIGGPHAGSGERFSMATSSATPTQRGSTPSSRNTLRRR